MMERGYFGIGVFHSKTPANIGTLMRSAYQLGAEFIFTIGKRYPRTSCDTVKSWRHIPLYHYIDMEDFHEHMPYDCQLIGIEFGGVSVGEFTHPERAIYLLGAEDSGLPEGVREQCHRIISLESVRQPSYNVAVAGSIVMYDRLSVAAIKQEPKAGE